VVAAASQAASAGPEPAAIFIAVGFLPVAAWGVTTFVTALGGGPAEKTSTLGNKMANARFPAGAGSTVTPAGTRDAKDIFMGGLENMSKDPTGWFFGDASPLYGSPPPAAPLPVQRESRVASRRSAPYVPPVAAPPSVSQVGSSRKGKATSRKARRAPPPATPEEVAARRGLNTGLSGVVEPVGSFAAPPAAMSPPAPKPVPMPTPVAAAPQPVAAAPQPVAAAPQPVAAAPAPVAVQPPAPKAPPAPMPVAPPVPAPTAVAAEAAAPAAAEVDAAAMAAQLAELNKMVAELASANKALKEQYDDAKAE